MIGAGIVLLIFGIIGLVLANGLSGSGGDAMAFIEFPFLIGGFFLTLFGVVLVLFGIG